MYEDLVLSMDFNAAFSSKKTTSFDTKPAAFEKTADDIRVPSMEMVQHFLFALVSYLSDNRVTGGELFEDIVAREYYSEADAR